MGEHKQELDFVKRKVHVANFRMFTEHDLLYKHLARFNIVESPICTICNREEKTSDHLLTCCGLDNQRNNSTFSNDEELFSYLYWYVRNLQ